MNKIIKSIALFMLTLTNVSYAVKYTYNGPNYLSTIGPYTTDMNITAVIEFERPIEPSVDFQNITDLVINYQLSDGLKTISNDPQYDFGFVVRTDESGKIIEWVFGADMLPYPTKAGDSLIQVASVNIFSNSFWLDNSFIAECIEFDGFCSLIGNYTQIGAFQTFDQNIQNQGFTYWSVSDLPPKNIPVFSKLSIIIMLLMVGLFGLKHINKSRVK